MDFAATCKHISSHWPRLVRRNTEDRGSLLGLPHPYMVPADGTLFQEMYYWDLYFTSLGLADTKYETFILYMTANLASLFKRFLIIPNGSRYYFLSRSQPPFFSALVGLAYDVVRRRFGDARALAYLGRMIAVARREYKIVWMGKRQPNVRQVHRGLSRYYDANYLHDLAACESGWDHTSRCYGRWLDHLPCDLNSILFDVEQRIARAAKLLGETGRAARWRGRAVRCAAVMQELMWDAGAEFFFDYDFKNEKRNPLPSLAGFTPLWAGLAEPEQAERMVKKWLPRFLGSRAA